MTTSQNLKDILSNLLQNYENPKMLLDDIQKTLETLNEESEQQAQIIEPVIQENSTVVEAIPVSGTSDNLETKLEIPKIPLQSEKDIDTLDNEDSEAVHNPEEKRREALKQMRYYAMWDGNKHKNSLQREYDIFINNGGTRNYADKLIQDATDIKEQLREIKNNIINGKITCSRNNYPNEVKQLINKYPTFTSHIKRDIDWAIGKRNEIQNLGRTQNQLLQNIPKTQNTPIHELQHQEKWDLLIDESGHSFNSDEAERANSCIVGVLAPADDNIEPLEMHGMEEANPKVKLNILKQLIQRKHWSIFGLRLSTIAKVKGEQWIDAVTEIIAWVIRLLPAEQSTSLTVHVEQRDPHVAGSEQSRIERLLLQSLAQVDPNRANNITLDVRFVYKYNPQRQQEMTAKGKNYPTHPWLAYADIVAHLWHSNERVYRTWMKESGLTHRFLHTDLYPKHMRILDTAFESREAALTGDAWSTLVSDAASNHSHVIKYISSRWQEKTRNDPKQWDRCIDEWQRHLYSKAISMRLLIQQSDWLRHTNQKEKTYVLSKRDELIFEISFLASKNHNGELVTAQDIEKLQKQQKILEDEDIRLICLLDLHLAVQFTHTFNFQGGIELIERWTKEDIRAIGRNYMGRVQSTMGQLFAFQNKNEEAIEYFDAAIETFGTLSSPDEVLREQKHTRTYKIIAMMDSNSQTYDNTSIEKEFLKLYLECKCASDEDKRQFLPKYGTIEELCDYLKTTKDDADKYIHHIFVRYLYLKQPQNLISQYLARAEKFKTGQKHPWGWICFYRALLLEGLKNDKIAHKYFRHAILQVEPHGIEEAIRVVFLETARRKNVQVDNRQITTIEIQNHIQNIAKNYPNPNPCKDNIKDILNLEEWEPKNWIHTLLPFNFH